MILQRNQMVILLMSSFDQCTQNQLPGDQESSLFHDNNFEKYNYCDNAYDPTDEGMLDSVLPNIEVGCNEFAKKSNGDFIDALSTCLIDSMVDREISGMILMMGSMIVSFYGHYR